MSFFDLKKLTNKKFLVNAAKQAANTLEKTSETIQAKTAEYASEKLNEFTDDETSAEKAKEKYQAFENYSQGIAKKASNVIDKVAETTSTKVNEVTGLETTPKDIKKAATVAVLAISAAGALEALADEGLAGGAELSGGDLAGGDTISAGGAESFEEETSKFFADKGGLNIQTDVVDIDGCILDSGA